MEAAWLVAVIVVPVFFNIYSSRIFEPDKISILRSLALIILVAWLIKIFEEGGIPWILIDRDKSWWKTVLRIPLIGPVFIVAIVYIVASIFSITPRISILGSYVRLQGLYTTLSYLVIFAAMVVNLRRREQVGRLIGAVILASLPVSLYGILQRSQLDPIPWGGDVSIRIAANMGNSIFVAAYLVMVIPITILRIVETFDRLMEDRSWLTPHFVRAVCYVFVLALQSIAMYYSGSRGPWLGWAASLIVIWLGLSLIWRLRWLTISGVVIAILAGAFLLALNLPQGPLENLRTQPEFGRLGQLLDMESPTARVRTLIWGGAYKLVRPHDPLEYPNGKEDTFHVLRPIIGYGPESMLFAYNRFYPPELAQVEKRNRSPDRAHNETWDSLVITGVFGLAAYLTLFGSVLYYGLKWLGLVQSSQQRNLFMGLYLAGGLLSSIIFVTWQGWGYLGVALPFGMILGVITYSLIISLFGEYQAPDSAQARMRAYFLLALLAGVMAHYVEINFGIAIVATRTYFWVYTALLVLIGLNLPGFKAYDEAGVQLNSREPLPLIKDKTVEKVNKIPMRKRKKYNSARRRRFKTLSSRESVLKQMPDWLRVGLISAFITTILLVTLGFDLITNNSRTTENLLLVWNSFTKVNDMTSWGILGMIVTTLFVGTVILVSEGIGGYGSERKHSPSNWLKAILVSLGVSILLSIIYWWWHAGNLAVLATVEPKSLADVMLQVIRSENLLTNYYVYIFILLLGLAFILPLKWPTEWFKKDLVSVAVGAASIIIVLILIANSNLRIIRADISYKTADLFANVGNWQPAIEIGKRASSLAPFEDHYYLFLGRAYLEQAELINNSSERDRFIAQAVQDLREAQKINPLNPDHTANLARLHSKWASITDDKTRRQELASVSEDYFATALNLSPNNARLWNEWALLYLNILGLPDEAYERLTTARELDPYYDWTYGLLGDYALRYLVNNPDLSTDERHSGLEEAEFYYAQAIELSANENNAQTIAYSLALAAVQTQLDKYDDAIQTYETILPIMSGHDKLWQILETLAHLYAQIGEPEIAFNYANQALGLAPEDEKEDLIQFITQLGNFS